MPRGFCFQSYSVIGLNPNETQHGSDSVAADGGRRRWVRSEKLEKFTGEEKVYHTALLIDAHLVEGEAVGISHSVITRLTWSGHHFLDAMRDDTVWKKAKEHVLKPGASWTFDILKEWLKAELKVKLGMPI